MTTTQPSYYTQASNFVSTAQGGVDPRTGLFSFSMPLANLVGNNNLGPALPLALSYTPLSTDNSLGLGIGCSLGLSNYDHKGGLLTLSTGEQYPIVSAGSGPNLTLSIVQKKLDNFKFDYLPASDEYQITYKSGQIEILQSIDGGNTYLPVRMFTPAGHGLTLTWSAVPGQLHLTQISDDNDVLCELSYNGNIDVTLTFWPKQPESYSVQLLFQGYQIHQVINQAETPNLVWTFGFSTVTTSATSNGHTYKGNYTLLSSIQAPTGYTQTATYDKVKCMPFPSGANQAPLPVVTSYTQDPGFGQPILLTRYSYTPNNYLGNGAGLKVWSSSQDNLYEVLSSYTYGSTESQCDYITGEVLGTTQRTYNNYHLLTQELSRQGTCSKQTDIEYYAVIGESFDQQLPQYQLPTKQTVTYMDTSLPANQQSRQAVTLTTFDEAGNQLTNVTPDGSTTTWKYYPAEGLSGGCPPEPNGFVRFIMTQTVTPAPSAFAAPTSMTTYTYQSLSGPYAGNGNPIASVVVSWQEKRQTSTQTLSLKTTQYVDAPKSAEHGRVQSIFQDVYGDDGKTYAQRADFEFATSGDALIQTATATGHDKLTISVGKNQSRFSGLTRSVTDRYGNQTTYQYDKLGRVTRKTANPGTAYENWSATSYTLADNGKTPPTITEVSTTVTDVKGNASKTYHDGMGRVIRGSRNDMDQAAATGQPAQWYDVQTQTYDNLGRPLQSVATDYLRHAGSTEVSSSSSSTSSVTAPVKLQAIATKFYDDWGQSSLTSYNDGHNVYGVYAPVSLETIVQIQGQQPTNPTMLGKTVMQFDLEKLTSTSNRYDGKGTACGSRLGELDGLKRLRRSTDEMGNVTQYEYDDYGRVSKSTLPDGTVVEKSYAPFSAAALITGIQVTDGVSGQVYALGTQTFDSLHRLTQSTSGGRTYDYHYSGVNAQPDTVTSPQGEVVAYQYIPQLGDVVHTVSADAIAQTLNYDPTTGAMTNATEAGGMVRTMTYTPSGMIDTETFAPAGGTSKSAQYLFSLQGNGQLYRDVAGTVQSCTYNANGSVNSINDPALQVQLHYDELGRFIGQTASDANGHTLTTTLTLNDFGQEIQRDFYENGAKTPAASIAQSYFANGQRHTRTTTQNGVTLRDETTEYDVRNRLHIYTCTGTAQPQDQYGHPIQKQVFEYDGLSNITQCVTTFADGSSDIANFKFTNSDDPTQLISVTHTHAAYPASLTFVYDKNGRMVQDEAARALGYDALGRLQSITGGGTPNGSYLYDALDTLVGQVIGDGEDTRELYYRSSTLVNEYSSAAKQQTRFVKMGSSCVGQSTEAV